MTASVSTQRAGKTALMWHHLRQESKAVGRPIECVACHKPHAGPPALGRCVCGGYLFGIRASGQLPFDLGDGQQCEIGV
jgi:hypothetical protein